VKIDSVRHAPDQIAAYRRAGWWTDTTTVDLLDLLARTNPERIAIADVRIRLSYAEYARRSQRLAAYFIQLGLTGDDVIALQLPNWTEFAIVVNAAMLAGIPFCQVHSDFRSREIEFVLRYTSAAVFICPVAFRRFDYLAMIDELRPALPALHHVMAVGDNLPADTFDLRAYLDSDAPLKVSVDTLRARRPHGDDLARVAFTSGTTGDPKAVLHLHNTTNSAVRFANRGHGITRDSVVLVFLPAGMNWGLLNVLQTDHAGRVRRSGGDASHRARVCHVFLLCAGASGRYVAQPRTGPLRPFVAADRRHRRRVLPDRGDPRIPYAFAR
jgi:non-ribosomal peptide synthetase component E (peptide arylation enzyme)